MSEIRIFESPVFGQIRTTTDEKGEPLFCLKDVCSALLVEGRDVRRRLRDGVVSTHPTVDSLGRKQSATFVNESGLYDAILFSRKPEAQVFRNWVTGEVLPQIRKTGGYIPVQENDDEKTILAKAVQILMRTVEQKDSLIAQRETVIRKQSVQLEHQGSMLEQQRPLVEFAHTVGDSEDTCTIAQLAKEICNMGVDMGQNRLFEWLREHKYLGVSEHHRNVPYQYWVEKGIFVVKTSNAWYDEEGKAHYNMTTLVTGKGQQYFINKFRSL